MTATGGDPSVVDRLRIDQLPSGGRSRLSVRLVETPLGESFAVPVLVAKGRRPGPVFGITAAVHGNELNGIPVIHRLLSGLDLGKLRGTVVAVVVVNVPGLMLHQRGFIDGADLNHIMPGRPDGNLAQVYAYRFIDRIVGTFASLVDLHTASFGRVNSLYIRADMQKPSTREMALLLRPEIIVHNPPSDTTLRGAAEELGIPAVTVEIRDPQRFQRDPIKRALTGLRALLGAHGLLPRRAPPPGPGPVLCERSFWIYTDRGGLLEVFPAVTDRVSRGDVIARLTNIFGDPIVEYRAPDDGVVVGKSTDPVAQAGARILHLGVVPDTVSHD